MGSWGVVGMGCCSGSKPVFVAKSIEDMATSNLNNTITSSPSSSSSSTTTKRVGVGVRVRVQRVGCCWAVIGGCTNTNTTLSTSATSSKRRGCRVRASTVDSFESSSSDFVKRIEQAWLISQQPRPIACSSCNSNGHVECKWCGGTGFFILGDNMLCQVPSRNTTCVICGGKGSMRCCDCKGTGFRAKWLGEPPVSK
uniref:Chaperone protein dnaJ n=1 Tax=Rhizophora mucronata TaxID=61149 RepID=A0A2P2IMC4_RHIMU